MTELAAHFSEARKSFHAALLNSVLRTDDTGVASNADRHHLYSVRIAGGIVNRLGAEARGARLAAQRNSAAVSNVSSSRGTSSSAASGLSRSCSSRLVKSMTYDSSMKCSPRTPSTPSAAIST